MCSGLEVLNKLEVCVCTLSCFDKLQYKLDCHVHGVSKGRLDELLNFHHIFISIVFHPLKQNNKCQLHSVLISSPCNPCHMTLVCLDWFRCCEVYSTVSKTSLLLLRDYIITMEIPPGIHTDKEVLGQVACCIIPRMLRLWMKMNAPICCAV